MTRIIYRNPAYGKAVYGTFELTDLKFVPAAIEEYHSFDGQTFAPRKVSQPDRVRILTGSSIRDVPSGQLADYVRRPTAKALARVEAAEAAIKAAREELKAATRAAFTYGKPIPLSTVKTVTRDKANKAKQAKAETEAFLIDR